MKITFLILFVVLANVTTTYEQSTADGQNSVLKAQVAQRVLLKSECRENNGIRMKLMNETNWAISVPTFSMYVDPVRLERYTLLNGSTIFLLPSDKEISTLFYWVESEKRVRGERLIKTTAMASDNSSTSWIAPRSSIFFDVPEKYFIGYQHLYVKFNYEWEQPEKGLTVVYSPEHRAYHPGLANEGITIANCP
jgi:hypothetical protein